MHGQVVVVIFSSRRSSFPTVSETPPLYLTLAPAHSPFTTCILLFPLFITSYCHTGSGGGVLGAEHKCQVTGDLECQASAHPVPENGQ